MEGESEQVARGSALLKKGSLIREGGGGWRKVGTEKVLQ